MLEAEPTPAWSREAPNQSRYFTLPTYETPSDKTFRQAVAESALLWAGDPDGPHEYLVAAAAAAGHR